MPSLPPADSAGAVPGGGGGQGGRSPAAPAIPAPAGGLAFLLARLPSLSRCFCPHPPDPLPGGKGETKVIFMQGASPLASPGLSRRRHLQTLPKQKPCGGLAPGRRGGRGRTTHPAGGGQGGRSPAAPAIPAPAGGGLPFSSPAYPAFTFFSAPYPPQPPSPVGKGETKVIFMQGASPLASPGLNPRGTSYPRRLRPRRGGVSLRCRGGGRWRRPKGWRAFLVARLPCLWFASCPLSPRPPSQREGGFLGYFMQGASPLASLRLNPWFAAKPTGIGFLQVMPPRVSRRAPAWQAL